jgi:dephospho-CoA kinase
MNDSLKPALKVGVTGGIGSGKTTVCKVFAVLGIPVFSADNEAKKIMESDRDIIQKINSLAGKDLYSTGNLDRSELAKLIFNDRELLGNVNSIVHPAVFKSFMEWAHRQPSPYAIMEAAILFESGASKLVDKVLTVVTPLEERIERLTRGNKMTRDQVMERIKNQVDDNFRIKRSDFIINNSENDMIIPAILKIHRELLNNFKRTE